MPIPATFGWGRPGTSGSPLSLLFCLFGFVVRVQSILVIHLCQGQSSEFGFRFWRGIPVRERPDITCALLIS